MGFVYNEIQLSNDNKVPHYDTEDVPMGRYDGIRCPVCGEVFKDKDDVVVCPDCGAPHHRGCYETRGECAYEEKHATGEEWRRPPKQTIDGNAPARCPRCDTLNPPQNIYCEVCGSLLNNNAKPPVDADMNTQQGQPGPQVFVMPYNPFTTPYGGLHADETIDDIPVKEIAMFIGPSSYYYLPRFKAMSMTKKRASWNWAAFFGNALYFCGRRMYSLGVLLAAIFLIRLIPGYMLVIENYDRIAADAIGFLQNLPPRAQQLLEISQIINYIYWIISGLLGVFSNYLYKRHVFDCIRTLKGKYTDVQQYYAALKKHGGLRTGLIVGLAITAFLLFIFSDVLISFFLVLPSMG